MNLYSKYIYNLYGDDPNVVKYLTYADRLYTFYITLYLNFEGHTESSINKSFSKKFDQFFPLSQQSSSFPCHAFHLLIAPLLLLS